jgi:hypothetical protein
MPYLGIIYDPFKEQQRDDLFGGDAYRILRPQAYVFSCQIPEGGELVAPTTIKGKNGTEKEMYNIQGFKSMFFRPSSNLDIDSQDWQHCIKDRMIQWRLSNGALTVVEPDKESVEREPDGIGYRMFGLPDTLRLVSHTKDLDTLLLWSSMEKRLEVQEAIAQQKEAIEKHIRMLREG